MHSQKDGSFWLFSTLLVSLAIWGVLTITAPAAQAHEGVVGHGFLVEPEIDWDSKNQILAIELRLSDDEHQVEDADFELGWMRYQADQGIACQIEDFGLSDNLSEALKERGFGDAAYQAQKDVYHDNSLGGLFKSDERGTFISIRDALELMDEATRKRFIDGADSLGICFLLVTKDEQHLILKELTLSAPQIRSNSIEPLEPDEPLATDSLDINSAAEIEDQRNSADNQDKAALSPASDNDQASEEGSTSLIILAIVLILLSAIVGIIFFISKRKNNQDLPPIY